MTPLSLLMCGWGVHFVTAAVSSDHTTIKQGEISIKFDKREIHSEDTKPLNKLQSQGHLNLTKLNYTTLLKQSRIKLILITSMLFSGDF